ncbi:MAG: hypothetical protein MK102_01940 [Fuerstiella sp.]|nr:hypothetical protein [Fuerstiella sp.]
MTAFGWMLVIGINAAIILFGLWKARETHESVDWFLAARGLPWWMVGLSMFATAVDSGDYVAVAGRAYQQGMPFISAWWIGMTIGWMVMTWVVLVPMYRSGMFTNCEYLEYRFGPTARVIAVFIQLQTRTNVLGNVAFSLYLTFDMLTGWGQDTWWLVTGIAIAAAAYTAMGGLKSVAVTDSLQSVVMLVAGIILWWTVWSHVGGWSGIEAKLTEHTESGRITAELAHAMTHVGGVTEPNAPAWMVVVGFVLVMTSYCVINQSQAMRMLASRSKWDMRMAAAAAAAVTAFVLWFNITLGVMGRALVPDLETGDRIFPLLVQQYLFPMGDLLTAIVVAGLLAGGISTYDSIGSALASVFTRDIYARFMVRQAGDRHYVKVSRCVTFAVIGLSFVYIPFLKGGMVELYLQLVGVAVMPLLTVYLMGVLTRVSRSSGAVGLCVGIVIGLTRFADPVTVALFDSPLPVWWTGKFQGYLWSCGITFTAMIITSMLHGWASREDVGAMMFRPHSKRHDDRETESAEGWLDSSRVLIPEAPEFPFEVPSEGLKWFQRTSVWTTLVICVVLLLNLVIFW